MPFVAIGHTESDRELNYVDLDFEEALHRSVGHLAALGHRQVAFLTKSASLAEQGYGPVVRAQKGFEDACSANALSGLLLPIDSGAEAGRSAVQGLMKEHPDTTALVIYNEDALVGILSGLQSLGLSIPADVSVVAVAPAGLAQLVVPPLTTADIPSSEMSRTAVELLLRLMDDKTAARHAVMLHPAIVDRGSTAAPRSPA